MDPQIVPFDLHRMFLGDDPPLYYLEIVVRCLVIYLWTIILLRWIGGRSVNQLSLVEFLLVIALGSAVGDALFYPEVPLFHAMLVILLVVVINKVIDEAILRWEVAKRIVDGDPVELMRDGRILGNSVSRRTMGHAELTSALRAAGIRNLGEIERVYMEANGKLSIFRRKEPVPGLVIMPPHEIDHPLHADPPRRAARVCCESCGLVMPGADLPEDLHCPECGHDHWVPPDPVGA